MYSIDLEVFLEKNKLKNKDLAKLLNLNPNFISAIKKGRSKLPQEKIIFLLESKCYDTSMIKEVKKNQNLADDTITMSREVFELIRSQQRTIESQQEELKTYRGGTAQKGEPAANADVG